MRGFRDDFGELLTEMDGARVVVLIDDLDRSLPDDVLGALEAIKLFLSVKGMAFVIATDDDFIRESLRDVLIVTGAPCSTRIDASVGAGRIADQYQAGTSTYQLAELAGVSRQTVSRLLADRSTSTRRGRPPMHVIDERWLRHQYLDQRLTIGQIASLVGCTTRRSVADYGTRGSRSAPPGARAKPRPCTRIPSRAHRRSCALPSSADTRSSVPVAS